MMKTYLKPLAAAGVVAMTVCGTANAQVAGGTSDAAKVQVGESTVNGGPHVAGRVGISVPSIDGRFVDFRGLQLFAWPDLNGVSFVNQPTGTTTDHSRYGAFRFAKVSGQDVYFGEWSQTGNMQGSDHTVYYAGNTAGTSVPTSGTATYAVKGISDYANKGALAGTFTARFGSGTSGRLTGSLENTATGAGLNIGVAVITGATFNGQNARATQGGANVATGGVVNGRFYGANAAALAGIATFANARQHDTAFGGTKN